MSATTSSLRPIALSRLQQALREVEPAALLLSRRILRRIIKRDRGLGGLGLNVPHRKTYLIQREALLRLASPQELEIASAEALPATFFLLEQPDALELVDNSAGHILRHTWRLLFHLRVHHEVGRLSPEAVQTRVHRLGAAVFEEIHQVLRQENYLFEGDDIPAVWEEFTSIFLELYFFEPHRLAQFFPAIEDPEKVYRLLTEKFEAGELFRRTRLAGADDPDDGEHEALPPVREEPLEATTSAPDILRHQARLVASRGNQVRAIFYRLRAIDHAAAAEKVVLRGEVQQDVQELVARLQRALQFAPAEQADWVHCLAALAEPASRAIWSQASRLLYDLQKVCIDVERPAFAADLVEWIVSWFHRPIKRPLPDLPMVLAVKHLRQARGRLSVVPLEAGVRQRLDELTAAAQLAAEDRLRQTLRPKLLTGFDEVGLAPANVAERFSRDKLVEELLDLIIERGYLSLGDLRDGLARNQLKLPDLAGPITFLIGDPLIRLNRDLAARLDGIYRRGEIYLRWLQRLSSLFFGTPPGRLLTLYILLPLLGSFFILKGIDGLSEEFVKIFGPAPIETPDMPPEHPGLHTFNLVSFGVLAVFLVPMLHLQRFRHVVLLGLWYLWLAVRGLLFDLPAAGFRLPLVRYLLQTRTYLALYQYAGKPIAWTIPLGLVLILCGVGWLLALGICAAGAFLISVLLNSRFGMLVEETAGDWFGQTWRLVRDDLVPGAFRWVIWASHWLLEHVDKMLYTVDEWLRFRTGESSISFVFKVFFGLIWFVVTYVVRLLVNVFIEPQINPIKHFPVVTVSHKLMLLLVFPIGDIVANWLQIKQDLARTLVGAFLALIPGMFGFLAWELKENWRLYRANRSPTLDPAVVGSHGERIINLLRPGFHSGTLPKLYARIRRARGSSERKKEVSLHHVETALQRFVERDLIAVVQGSKAWNLPACLRVSHIHVATNRIRVELSCAGVSLDKAWLALTYRGGWLVGNVVYPGFLASLPAGPRQAFDDALDGFFHWCGIDFLAQPLAALSEGGDFDLTQDRLIVFLDTVHSRRVEYDLSAPEKRVEVPPGTGLPDRSAAWLYGQRPIRWADWVACWQADEAGVPSPGLCAQRNERDGHAEGGHQ